MVFPTFRGRGGGGVLAWQSDLSAWDVIFRREFGQPCSPCVERELANLSLDRFHSTTQQDMGTSEYVDGVWPVRSICGY